MYPGLIVGVLYGLSIGGIAPTIVSAFGGLAGAIGYAFVQPQLALPNGPLSLGLLVASAFAGAFLFSRTARLLDGKAR